MAKRQSGIKKDAFIQLWNESASVDEVMEKTGMPRNSVLVRASTYRTKGTDLKKMPRKPRERKVSAEVAAASSEAF